MGKTMIKAKKLFQKHCYSELYELLEKENYEYSLENISRDFSNKESMNLYCYLLYVLSIRRTSEIYLLICDFLMFQDTWFSDIFPMIKWILDSALEQETDNSDIKEWILSVFFENPDSPYTAEELYEIKNSVEKTRNGNQGTVSEN